MTCNEVAYHGKEVEAHPTKELRIGHLMAETRNWDLSNTKQQYSPLHLDVRQKQVQEYNSNLYNIIICNIESPVQIRTVRSSVRRKWSKPAGSSYCPSCRKCRAFKKLNPLQVLKLYKLVTTNKNVTNEDIYGRIKQLRESCLKKLCKLKTGHINLQGLLGPWGDI
jgi:hypothetical protein